MRRAVTWAAMACASTMPACTRIPDDATFDADAGGDADAAVDARADSGSSSCGIQRWSATYDLPIYFVPATDGGAAGVALAIYTLAVPLDGSTETLRIEIYAVGDFDELLGKVAPLGAGNNKDWSTCTHCVLVYRGCDAGGWHCLPNPYFPSFGSAVVVHGSAGLGRPFEIDLARVVLRPVAFDGTRVSPLEAPDDDCIALGPVYAAGKTAHYDFCIQQDCSLAASAAARHVTP